MLTRVSLLRGLHVGQGIVFVSFMHGNLLLGSECKFINGIVLILKTESNISSLILLSTLQGSWFWDRFIPVLHV